MPNIQIIVPKFVLQNDEKKNVRRVLAQSGRQIVKQAKNMVRRAGGSGRYYPIGRSGHYASAPGQPPAELSGLLAQSILSKAFVRRHELGVRIRDTALNYKGKPYPKFLELGAIGGAPGRPNKRITRKGVTTIIPSSSRVLAPRPFISIVVEQMAPSIEMQIVDAFVDDIEFVPE